MQDWMKDVTMDALPEAHRKIAEIIGVEATLALCDTFGGMVLYVPKTDSIYASVRGKMIRAEFNGMNTTQLAKRYRVTTRTIQTIVGGMPPPPIDGQITLDELL
ncbi:MAG: Mor transcription activator family protein [Clostridia bacterium]